MSGLPPESLKQLKFFINHLQAHPDLLHTPELSFFKDYLEKLGAKVPSPPQQQAKPPPEPQPQHHQEPEKPKTHTPPKHEEPPPKPQPHQSPPPKAEEKVEEMDTDVPPEPAEPEDPHLWVADSDHESLPLGDAAKQASEEEMEQANDLLSEARQAAREQNYSEAIQLLSKAINLNPAQSNLYAFRAEYLLAQKKPKAAIRDTNRALELNPDSSRALKIRGKAKRYLGIYLEAFYDLSQGNSLDWDESTVEIIKEISERAERAKQRQRKEDEKHRVDQLKRDAAEKRRRQQEDEDRQQKHQGQGGMYEGLNDLFSQLQDPEIQSLLKNNPTLIQKVMKALGGDIVAAQDPDVQKIITKLQSSFAGPAPAGGPGGGHHPHSESGPHAHPHAHGGHPHSHSPPQTSHSKPKEDDDLD
jgi:suppressor of tumorigenicity protein 13